VNRIVSIYVRYRNPQGKRCFQPAVYLGKARLRPQPGGVFYIRWYAGKKPKHRRVGTDPVDAVKAQIRQENILAGIEMPREERSTDFRPTLAMAVEDFLLERSAQTDERGVARWRWELNLFCRVSGKSFLDEVRREDIFRYWKQYKDEGAAPRTCFNRVQSLQTFLRNRGLSSILLRPAEMPKYDEPPVDHYGREELLRFFAACDAEQRIRYQTFLYSGMREREVMFVTWADIDFDAGTITVQAKDGFTTKNRRSRVVPIPDVLVAALRTYKAMYPERKTVFVNKIGTPEGHFLGKLKDIVKAANLPGRWNLHKFRRTFATMHLENGTAIQDVRDWLGHADLTTLMRYLAQINVKSQRARARANALAECFL
jgi:integrase/recombinase XerD